MYNFKGLVLSVLMMGMLSACSYDDFSEVEALNNAQPVGSPFTQRLAMEYREFSNVQLNEMFDYPDALHFARKGLAASSGEPILPEPISDWNLSPNHVQELNIARNALMGVFDNGAREMMPDLAAIAQVRFDCWIEEQEENWQTDTTLCKNDFLAALSELENQLGSVPPMAVAPAPAPAPVPMPLNVDPAQPMKIENAVYLTFFDFDKSVITPEANSILDAAAKEIKNRADIGIVNVVGHTDTTGPADYNQRLAMRRAQAAMDGLVARGIDPSIIRMEGRGENDLIVETGDNVREPANRRASISFK